jgi:hypothetical protein
MFLSMSVDVWIILDFFAVLTTPDRGSVTQKPAFMLALTLQVWTLVLPPL